MTETTQKIADIRHEIETGENLIVGLYEDLKSGGNAASIVPTFWVIESSIARRRKELRRLEQHGGGSVT